MSFKMMESIDSGSNYQFDEKAKRADVPRSAFDLSHLITTTIPKAGIVYPLEWIPTLPQDDFDISVESLLRVLPQVVPLYSRQRMYIYAFHSRMDDLYSDFQVFARKGYSGNVVKSLPTLNDDNLDGDDTDTISADSIGDFLGLPQGATRAAIKAATCQSAPFMMNLRVKRDYFMNKNYYINDRVILPDDDSRFRLNDDGNLLSALDQGVQVKFSLFGNSNDISYDSDGNLVSGLIVHDYPSDRFTSALPFMQRGDEPSISLGAVSLDFSQAVSTASGDGATSTIVRVDTSGHFGTTSSSFNATLISALNKGVGSTEAAITLNQIRELAINQTILEKMAHTDGSYREFGLTMFGESSQASRSHTPQYVGGVYKNIAFTEVLQTSASDSESGQFMGSYAGHGISGINDGYLGHFHADDFGILMFYVSIMPDVYYHQGLDKKWTMSLQSDLHLPDRDKLGMQPIYNQELYYQGNNGSDSGEDKYLWAYQSYGDEYRYLPNQIRGKIADSSNASFYPYTQARTFTELPNYGQEFAQANDIRTDYLAASSEDAYTAQFKFNIRAVRQLPYRPQAASII